MKYALIENGIVENVIWLSPSNEQDFQGAVPLKGLPVRIGDTYAEGVFYRNGERVLSAQEMALAEADAAQAAYEQGVQEA